MHRLLIRHVDGSDPPRFLVVRLSDGASTDPVEVPTPARVAVGGRPGATLMSELGWYLEQFLDYPFPPQTDHAEQVLAVLEEWGKQAFTALFGGGRGRDWYRDGTREGLDKLQLEVSSDDPGVLSWPWEVLRDPEVGLLALGCRIGRRLNRIADPLALPSELPRDRVNILLVTARPYEADVGYRSISRPLVELIEKHKLPARVRVLRPPTLARLRQHLRERPGFYHLLHFDGHGGYGKAEGGSPYALQGSQGHLVFETEAGKPDPVSAETLQELLREHRVPAVVLNACQSAKVDDGAEDAFASVAAALVRAGIRSVVAMAYSLYVSGAEEFLPAFYRRLFESGELSEATRAGRQAMYQERGRVCARGRHPLEDWLVPVVYQQQPVDLSFASRAAEGKASDGPALPPEAGDEENPYGFIGRDGAVLAIERAMRRPPAGILVHGLGGVGKTTLARGLVQWLAETEGLGQGCFWFTFNDIRSAEYVVNRMGGPLLGDRFLQAPMAEKVEALAAALKEHRFVVVWDNFESVRGIEGTSVEALLSAEDQAWLKRLLEKLRGGETKVILTSRSEEEWLGSANRYKLPLAGLQGEERWEFCDVILRDLGLSADREDPELAELMEALDGHPLMMRAILPQLEDHTAGELATALRTNFEALGAEGDPTQAKVFATLGFVETSLAEELRPLLIPLAFHERFVDADYLEAMASGLGEGWTRAPIDRLLAALGVAGLVRDRGQAIHELHPALTGFLRSRLKDVPAAERDRWARVFVDFMGSFADALAPKPLHEQRFGFHIHGATFHAALAEAERLGMDQANAALTQSLAAYALNTRNFPAAEALLRRLVEHWKQQGQEQGEASAYHQLGMVAQERRDFPAADGWYRKSLEIKERLGNEQDAASTYHQLGIVAQERRDFPAADGWYKKSLAIEERLGDEHGAASTYHQLGIVAQERRDFAAAERWYKKSLEIEERLGNEHGAAITYHQLGRVAQERRDFPAADGWYRKSLEIKERLGIEPDAAITYHQLGRVAELRRDFAAAEGWYRKALDIKERLGNEHGAASTYHQLGIVAQERRDFAAAEGWYRKSLEIEERLGNEHAAATTYHQLGMVAQERRDFLAAEGWYRKSLEIEERLGNEHGAALTYGQLGILAGLGERYEESARWLVRCISTLARLSDPAGAKLGSRNFLASFSQAPEEARARMRAIWEEAGLGPLPSE